MAADRRGADATTYGVVLPHFGPGASRDALLDGARAAERSGYHCLWARDHVVFTPHPWEPAADLFVEQYVTLAAVAAVTGSIGLGAGATIPFRSAHHVLALAESLSIVAARPVNIGLGLGDYAKEMALTGVGAGEIPARRRETIELLQSSRPRAEGAPIDLWWAGGGPKAVSTAVDRRINWLAGRQPLATLTDRMALLERLSAGAAWRPKVAVWVLADFDARTGACGERLPMEVVGRFARGGGEATDARSGGAESSADAASQSWRGSVLRGDTTEVRADLEAIRALGVDHIVVDFRFSPADSWIDDMSAFHQTFLNGDRCQTDPPEPSRGLR